MARAVLSPLGLDSSDVDGIAIQRQLTSSIVTMPVTSLTLNREYPAGVSKRTNMLASLACVDRADGLRMLGQFGLDAAF